MIGGICRIEWNWPKVCVGGGGAYFWGRPAFNVPGSDNWKQFHTRLGNGVPLKDLLLGEAHRPCES